MRAPRRSLVLVDQRKISTSAARGDPVPRPRSPDDRDRRGPRNDKRKRSRVGYATTVSQSGRPSEELQRRYARDPEARRKSSAHLIARSRAGQRIAPPWEDLRRWYWEEGHALREIAARFGCDR